MSQLIPVSPGTIGGHQCLTISGRELHSVLGVRRVFAAWMPGRIEKYGFVQGQDFEVFSNSGKNSEGGRPSQEYTLSLDMGKELCMVENNEKGRIARRYFIECERRLLVQPALPIMYDEPAAIEAKMQAIRAELFNKTVTFMNDMEDLSGRARKAFDHPGRVSNVGTPFDVFASEQCRIIASLAEQAYRCGDIAVRQMQVLSVFGPHLKKLFG